MTTDPKDAEIARLRMALAETEALEMQHGAVIDRLRAERDAKDKWLGELLAVIHRDGGHYQDEHGDEKAVRDAHLILADLRAERDRRDAQMRAEGRKEGLREAAGVADHFRDSCGECNWPEDAVMVGVNVADDIARAILAKIKEADHE